MKHVAIIINMAVFDQSLQALLVTNRSCCYCY